MTPIAVTVDMLDEWLPKIEWHLAQFCANGQFAPEDMIAQIMRKERQLWVIEGRCVLLTSVLADRLNTVVVSHCVGAGYEEWLPMWAVIEAWAHDIGAKRIEVICRPGWERPLAQYGLKKTHVVLEKRL